MRARALLVFGFLFVCACQSAKKPATPPSEETPSTGAAATPVVALEPNFKIKQASPGADGSSLNTKPLTSTGENSDARFSTDGSRILFVSRARPTHKQAQVYELHLGVMKEKRVTFHDGDDIGPVYAPGGTHFLFSSVTDEIKEEPHVAQRLMKAFYPDGAKASEFSPDEAFEAYQQTLHGRAIERLTKSPGFDGDLDVDAKGKRFVFSSRRGKRGTNLYFLRGKSVTSLTTGEVIDRGARFSPDGKTLVWSRQTKSDDASAAAASNLMLADGGFQKPKLLAAGTKQSLQPSWHPSGNSIVFSSNRDGERFNLYVVDRAGTCVRRLTDVDFDQMQPVFRPDGKQLIFTGRRNGQLHLYLMDYIAPSDCKAAEPTPPAPAPAATGPSATPAPPAKP